jgi:type I restriction enzyme, S subunit
MRIFPVDRLKWVGRLQYGDPLAAEDRIEGTIPVFGSNGIVGAHVRANTLGPALIIGRKGSFGKVTYTDVPSFCIDTAYYIDSRHTKAHLKWLFYALQSLRLDAVSRDTGVPGLSRETAHSALIPYVDFSNQLEIADFLDRETANIDQLIFLKRHFLALLLERDQGIKARSALQGVADTTELRESDYPWIGAIPQHWQLVHLKRVCDVSYGISMELDRTLSGGVPIISLPNVSIEGELNLDDVPFIPHEFVSPGDLLRRGDLLFNWRNGSPDHVGKTAIFDCDGEFTNVSFLLRLRPISSKIESKYLQLLLFALRARGLFSASKNQVNRTYNQTELRNLVIPVPPPTEQNDIVQHVHAAVATNEQLRKNIERQIRVLREYRASLVYAAVTGQIDVRNYRGKAVAVACQ